MLLKLVSKILAIVVVLASGVAWSSCNGEPEETEDSFEFGTTAVDTLPDGTVVIETIGPETLISNCVDTAVSLIVPSGKLARIMVDHGGMSQKELNVYKAGELMAVYDLCESPMPIEFSTASGAWVIRPILYDSPCLEAGGQFVKRSWDCSEEVADGETAVYNFSASGLEGPEIVNITIVLDDMDRRDVEIVGLPRDK